MKLIEEFTLLDKPLAIGDGPAGTRSYFNVMSGTISGKRLNGKILSGGEWALIGADGFLRVDVRLQAQTDDGANLYIQYFGLVEINEKLVFATTNGTETAFDEQYFYTNPRFETGDPRYEWVNKSFFIGHGRIIKNHGIEYKVYRAA